MNPRILRLIEVIGGSTVVFIALGYISGFSILNSFLNTLFKTTSIVGILFPPISMLTLGFILIFSFVLSIPLIISYVMDKNIEYAFLDIPLIFAFAFRKISDIHFQNITIPGWLIKLLGVIFIILVSRTIITLIKKVFYFLWSGEGTSASQFRILLLTMIPISILPYSSLIEWIKNEPSSLDQISLYFPYINFLPQAIYTFLITATATQYIISRINKFKSNKSLQYFSYLLLVVIFLGNIYSFSQIIGIAIARNYIVKNSGIFARIQVETDNKLISENKNLFLISENESYSYIFTINPNRLFFLPKNSIKLITVQD